MFNNLKIVFLCLFLLTACGGDEDSNSDQDTLLQPRTDFPSPDNGLESGTACASVRARVAAAIEVIRVCNVDSDCRLSGDIGATGYGCKRIGYNRNADTTEIIAALSAFKRDCPVSITCTADFVTAIRICDGGFCASEVDSY